MWKTVIIDDDRKVLRGMKKAIPWEELNAKWIGEAKDGKEGLELIRKREPDIVITDIYMPMMSGLDMMKQLRKENFQGKCVILSGYSDFEYARQALRLDITDYLTKPVTVDTIKEVLQGVIQQMEEESLQELKLEELRGELKLYEPFVTKEWVKSVVTGTIDLETHSNHDFPHLASWESKNHIVLGVAINESIRKLDVGRSDWYLFRFAVGNIIKEVVNETFSDFEFIELHSHHSAILIHLNGEMDPGSLLEKVRQAGQKMIECVQEYLNVNIQVGIGTQKTNWVEIKDSTLEAFHSLAIKEYQSDSAVNLFEFRRFSNEEGLSLAPTSTLMNQPMKLHQQLSESIRSAQREQTEQLIRKYMNMLAQNRSITRSDLQLFAIELWAILSYSLYDVGIDMDDIFPDMNLLKELEDVDSSDQLAEWLLNKVNTILIHQQSNENGKHTQIVEFMVEYIHEHFAENITLHDITDQIHISRNYLGQLFRRATGESFKHYLTRIRMEKAKNMLIEGNDLVYEVAEKVGYTNVTYFSSLFKKHTGISPTQLLKR